MSPDLCCLGCKHCTFYEGFSGSDVTPADGLIFQCDKGKWSSPDSPKEIKSYIDMAQTCELYDPETTHG